ncbi:MAG: iron-containing alcohol dehydrogenase [Candidatus Methanofastidiosia archaeon]|jgi:alcohol dehydrogenase
MKFHAPTQIFFGSGTLSKLHQVIPEAKRFFLVTDPGIKKAGIVDTVISQVNTVDTFDEVEQNPVSTTINQAAQTVRAANPDIIMGVGGGSSIDAAKALALLATNPGTIEQYEGKSTYKHPPLPIIAIPTTCGTGSEVTWVAVITDPQRKFKMSIKGPHMFPYAAVIDPDVLQSLPQSLIASTGMDALTHAIEAYTVKPRTLITDIFARKAVSYIFNSLKDVYTNITNKKAREHIMLGSTLAGIAFGNSDVGAVHCIAESIGGLYNVPHGVANSMFLPVIMEFNFPESTSRYADLGRLIGITDTDDAGAARKFIETIKELSHFLHIPSFKELGIKESDFPEIAQRSVKNNSNPSNPRKADFDDYLHMLTAAHDLK